MIRIYRSFKSYRLSGLGKIFLGILFSKQKIYINFIKKKNSEVLTFEDFKFLNTLIRVLPNKVSEYSAIPLESIYRIERLLQTKITPKIHLSRKLLFENYRFREILKKQFDFWIASEKSKVKAARLHFLLNYIIHGNDTPPTSINFQEELIEHHVIGNNSSIALSIKKQHRFLTFEKTGCVVVFCIYSNKVFFSHYSMHPNYEQNLFNDILKWKNAIIDKQSVHKTVIYIFSHKCDYYVNKLINTANFTIDKTVFNSIKNDKTTKLDILIEVKRDGIPQIYSSKGGIDSKKSFEELELSKFSPSI